MWSAKNEDHTECTMDRTETDVSTSSRLAHIGYVALGRLYEWGFDDREPVGWTE